MKPADEALVLIDLANVRNNMLEFGIVARGAFASCGLFDVQPLAVE